MLLVKAGLQGALGPGATQQSGKEVPASPTQGPATGPQLQRGKLGVTLGQVARQARPAPSTQRTGRPKCPRGLLGTLG